MYTFNLPRRFIENYPFQNLRQTWLISIANCDASPVQTNGDFRRILYVYFNDLDHWDQADEEERKQFLSDETTARMVAFIREANKESVDLIVNCHAGQCRSAAVVEVLAVMGWRIPENEYSPVRKPNQFVFNKLRKACGLFHLGEKA